MKTQGNATIMAEIIGLPQMSTYDTKAIIQVSDKIYHHLKNRLKVGVGDLKKASKILGNTAAKQAKTKTYSALFVELAQNDKFLKLFPYEETLKLLSQTVMHSDEETTSEKKILVSQPRFSTKVSSIFLKLSDKK